MKTVADPQFRPDVAGTQKELMRSGAVAYDVLTNTARNVQMIQSHAGAALFTQSLEGLVAAFSPGGTPYWAQQLPQVYSAQATSLMDAATATFSELLRAQQTLMEMGSQASWHNAQGSTDSTTQALRKFYSRRVSSQVIQFPERRAA